MDGIFGNLINAAAEIWKTIGAAQKISIILIGLLTIGVTAGIIYWGSQPEWNILYANLDTTTAAKVNDLVNEAGIPVKLTDSGRTILVPKKGVYKLRLEVAGKGIAVDKGGVGWDIFDNMKLGMTEQQQDVAFQRAIQGELEKMISQIPGVSGANVNLTLPKKKVFRKEKSHPSASIMVSLNQGRSLSPEQVNSIRYLVASAVSEMRPQDVTVTDNQGKMLAKQITDEEMATGDAGGQMEAQSQAERLLKEKAEAILRPIVGEDKVVAMVSCEMDFNSIDRIKEEYDDEKKAILSEKIVSDDSTKKGDNLGGGAVGASANLNTIKVGAANPAASTSSEDKTSTSEKSKTEERKYAVPKTVEKTTEKGGKIKKISVAVTIAKKTDGTARDTVELQKLTDLVIAAVGTTKENVQIKEMDFIKVEEKIVATPFLDTLTMNVEKIINSPLLRPIMGLALLFVLYRVFRRYFNKTSVEGAELAPGAIYSQEVKNLPAGEEQPSELENIMDSLQSKTSASPQNVAHLMENWLAADQG
ncbi:MAG: flagellar M-ring protein FliF [Lentisphaerae bacterium GWF2_52_8]|nr:MAG: flagellar M-ring protein FliF [Lentisphaerae bacterium GWF2_52_8]